MVLLIYGLHLSIPLRNYTQYKKVNNSSTYIAVPKYFVLSKLNNTSHSSVENTDKDIHHNLKPIKLNEYKVNTVTEIRKVNTYTYEKTKYDVSIDRSNAWRNKDNNVLKYNPDKNYNSGSSNTGTSSTSTGNNGNKGGNNIRKTTESSKKKSE
jgi:hypothetical protein